MHPMHCGRMQRTQFTRLHSFSSMYRTIITCFICVFIALTCAEIDDDGNNKFANYTKHDEDFVFLYPRTFLAGKNETVCAVVHNRIFPARLRIELKIKHKHFRQNVILHSEAECFNLTIPLHRNLDVLNAELQLNLETNGRVQLQRSYEPALVYPATDVIFMETDRQIYKPGDKVKMRIMQFTQDMQPTNKNVTNFGIKFINPHGFIVHIANNLISQFGLIHYEYQLTNETTLGTWHFEYNTHRKSFLVKPYILPRFKIYINAPKDIYINSTDFTLKVCSRYTFGHALRGYSFAKLTYAQELVNHATSKLQELQHDGCTSFLFNNTEIRLKHFGETHSTLNVFVTVTEDGTNQMETETIRIGVQRKLYELKLLSEAYYQPGLPYKNKLRVTRGFLDDYRDEYAEICYQVAWKHDWNLKTPDCTTLRFDKDGVLPFSILPLKENAQHVKVTARSANRSGISATPLHLQRWSSSSASYLKIERNSKLFTKCRQPQQFTVYFTTNKLKHNDRITFYSLISTTNDIITLKQHPHTVNKTYVDFELEIGNTIGTNNKYAKLENYVDRFVLKFKVPERIHARGHLIVFYLNKGETISNSINIFVEKCLPINVTAKWTSASIAPADAAKLIVKTKQKAVCAISTIDAANYFLDGSRRLNVNRILHPFLVRREYKTLKPNCVFQFNDGGHSKGINYSANFDTFQDLLNVGLTLISNTQYIVKTCKAHDEIVAPYYQIITDDEYNKSEDRNVIRSYFPETWHWDLIETDKHGSIVFKTTAPDTITTWNTNILCLSEDGVGVTNIKLTTSKLFFVNIIAPSSMQREEVLSLQISAYNYYNYSLPIHLTLNTTLEVIDQHQLAHVIEIPANEVTTKSVRLKARKLGNAYVQVQMRLSHSIKDWTASYFDSNALDVVEANLDIIADGYAQVQSKTMLLCGVEDDAYNLTWNVDPPDAFVRDSESVRVLLYTDLMGPALQNLEELIMLPTGCGEQIMAVMAPNFYVLRYLKAINDLPAHTRKRIVKNLQVGYQKILDYLHDDGSFSAFGHHDATGSMFLTAFVLRSLSAAAEYIFVDDVVIQNSLDWMLSHQLENGCFASVSHVFQDMGGASMENSTSALTSYVMISLLESRRNISEQVRLNAIYCIRGQLNPDAYSLAINTYALYLLNANIEADAGMRLLLARGNRKDHFLHWNCTKDSKSMNIETTAYALLALLHKITNDKLIQANAVVRWLLTQRNAQGGFTSSQDTVVAIEAISKYSALMNERNPDMNITITNEKETFHVAFKKNEPSRKEEFRFNDINRKIYLSSKGTGCILTQFLLHYNVRTPKDNEAFELTIRPTLPAGGDCLISTLRPCFKCNDAQSPPTMVVMEVFKPSGYEIEPSSLQNLAGNYSNLKKIEENASKVTFYFTDLDATQTVCVPFNMTRNALVMDMNNSTVLLYEYYNPNRQVIKTYNLPRECAVNITHY